MGSPITFIRWSPLDGLVVSAGREVHNVTSRGKDRWRLVAGDGHSLWPLDGTEVVWSPAFHRLGQLLPGGRLGWNRTWDGRLASDGRGGIFLLDASAVAAIGPGGDDRWRASPDGARELEGLFPCGEDLLFQGASGLQRVALRISSRGFVMRTTRLGNGSVLVGAGQNCEPLTWQNGELTSLDSRGSPIWRREAPDLPFVQPLNGGLALVSSGGSQSARLEVITDNGRVHESSSLPVSGRLTGVKVAAGQGLDVQALGLCLDVTSPCSRPDEMRGPFNALVLAEGNKSYRTLFRHVQGHLNFASYLQNEIVVAHSQDADSTELLRRDERFSIVWQVRLPGRLSYGPYVAPSGEIYVGTCAGWQCAPPHLLIAVTGQIPPATE